MANVPLEPAVVAEEFLGYHEQIDDIHRMARNAMPTKLRHSTAQAAFQYALGRTAATAGSASAATLANGVLKAMLWQKVKVVSVIFLAAAFFWTGASVVSHGVFGPEPPASKTEAQPNADREPQLADKKPARVDLYGEALPPGAIARMGTIQFRQPHSPLKDFTPDPEIGVAFSPDGQVIATSWHERLRLWNANTGKFLLEIKTADWSGGPVFSPDGRFIAAALAHYTPEGAAVPFVSLWDAKTGKLCLRLPPEKGLGYHILSHILFSPDSKLLALTDRHYITIGNDVVQKDSIHLWNTDTGKEIAVLSPESSASVCFASIAFSTDGKTLITLLHQPRKIWHWDIAKGEVGKVVPLEILDANKETEEGRTGCYNNYVLSADGGTLACRFFGDRAVRLLDTSTGKVRCQFQAQANEGHRMALSPDGRFVANAERTGDERKLLISVWDTKAGKLKRQFTTPPQNLGDLTFSPDGSRVILGGWYIRMYDVASGDELLNKPTHRGGVCSLAFTPDGSTLISGDAYGMIGIWDAATGKSRHFVKGHRWTVTGIALVPGGDTFVSCGVDGILRLHDWRTGKEVRRFGLNLEGNERGPQFKELRVSGDGKTVISQVYSASESKEPSFHSWDLATGKLFKTFPRQGDAEFSELGPDGKHFIGVKYSTGTGEMGFNKRGDRSLVEVREIATGRLLFTTEESDAWGQGGILAEDGRLLIRATVHSGSHGENPTIRLWELATGKERSSIVSKGGGMDSYYETIALAPDGRILATARRDRTLQLWDLLTGKELQRYAGYDESVTTMTFSPDGKFLATGHADGTIHVWDVSRSKGNPSPVTRSAKELESWWKDLGGQDAAQARTAIRNLVEASESAVGLFKERLRPAADKSERIPQLIAQLDDDKFAAREAASKELDALRSQAEPLLRRALDQNISLEARRRIEEILDRPAVQVRDPELLQGIRAIEVLETSAIPGADTTRLGAIDLLKSLAGGAPDARLTQEAKAALRRLETRKP